jgi:anti-anti-sigma regulatory factor
MLRISIGASGASTAMLRLEGQIIGLWVDELRKTAESYMRSGHPLVLDLSEVTFTDRDGVLLLADLQRRTVALKGCSPFLLEQLRRTNAN